MSCNVPNNRIPVIEYLEIQNRMYEDNIFLKKYESLQNIIMLDDQYLKSINITHNQIAEILENIYIIRSLNNINNIIINKKFEIIYEKDDDSIICPFQNKFLYPSNKIFDDIITIKNLDSNEEIKFNSIMIHMIKDHHFFGGKNTIYRLEPIDIIKILNIDYKNIKNYY